MPLQVFRRPAVVVYAEWVMRGGVPTTEAGIYDYLHVAVVANCIWKP
ncbi:hypothetical protein [Agriterribacter sp.]|nr:hypothetical protein [Agriterribacter sp.]HRP57711.1 hypothetical protein [Agriterribacter sp.]